MKKKIVIVLFLFINFFVFSQVKKKTPKIVSKNKPIENGYKIKIKTKNLNNEKLILFFNYGVKKQIVATDSCIIKSDEEVVEFKQSKKIIGAIYSIKFENTNKSLFLALDNGTQLTLSLNAKNIDSLNCISSAVNKDFLDYQLNKKLSVQEKETLRTTLLKKYPNSVLNFYFKVENAALRKKPTAETEITNFRNNYFSDINKKDKRLFLLPNLFTFLNNFVTSKPINNTNYKENINIILNGLSCNEANYKIIVKWFLSNLAFYESKNLDESYRYLYEKYIDIKNCEIFDAFEKNVYQNKHEGVLKLPINSIAPEFNLIDKDSVSYSFSSIYAASDYTIVLFYSPTCSHCIENTPKFSEFMETMQNKYTNLKINKVAILNDLESSKWQDFIKTSKIENWINLKESGSKLSFQDKFNSYTNPGYLLVNKKGEIKLRSSNQKAIEEIFSKNL